MNKRAIAFLFTTMLLAILCCNTASANPVMELGGVPPDAHTFPSKITVFSPTNQSIYTKNTIPLEVNVSLPESKTADGTMLNYVAAKGDWEQNITYLYANDGYFSIESKDPNVDHHYFRGSFNISGVPEGNHSLLITAVASGYYIDNSGFFPGLNRFLINSTSRVFFSVDSKAAEISFLTKNATYYTNSLPLDFFVSDDEANLVYSLDCQNNITLTGNTTIAGLSEGTHNVTLYAQDGAGNISYSTIIFTNNTNAPIIAAIIVAVVLTAVGLFYYRKKFFRPKNPS